MAKKKKGGRYTPPGTQPDFGRGVRYELTQKPNEDERAFIREMFQSGWARWMPSHVFSPLGAAYENTLQDSFDAFDDVDVDELLWESPHENDVEYLAERKLSVQRFADSMGIPLPENIGELMAVFEHFKVVQRDEKGRYIAPLPLPLVTETGVLTAEEIATEDRLRWHREFEGEVQKIIRVFVKDNRDEWRTSIEELSELLEVPVESARAAASVLGDEGDFSVLPDPELVDLRDELVITVDWNAFDESRIQLG